MKGEIVSERRDRPDRDLALRETPTDGSHLPGRSCQIAQDDHPVRVLREDCRRRVVPVHPHAGEPRR